MSTETPQGEITETELERLAARKDAEIREYEARYTTAEVEALGKKGQAFKNPDGHYSFPIANASDLSNAIQALGRAPDAVRDAVKSYIKGRASALGATDKLPESWRAAESELEERAVKWDEEHRSGPSFKDRHRAISDAIRNQPDGGSLSAYLTDFDDDTATYESGGKLFQVPYTEKDDGGITLGDAQEAKVGIVPREADEQFEWRKAKAEQITGARTPERRAFEAEKLEIRESQDGGWTLTGYASVTEVPYEVGFYTEKIARGAFKRTLKNEPDVTLLLNHGDGGSGLPLARTKSGTLTLEEDRNGLYVEANLDPLDPDAQLLQRKMKRGDLDGQMSFAFQAIDQDWSDDFGERTLRSVEINRGDVSIVTQGASPTTSSMIRSLNGAIDEAVAMEARAGRVLSSANVDTLKNVLSLAANADENLDKIQPMLSGLLGVANPDKPNESDANSEPDGSTAPPIVSAATDGRSALDDGDFTFRARQKLQAIEMRQKGRR